MEKYTTAQEALKVIKSNDFIYLQGGSAVPTHLIEVLTQRADELRNVTIGHIHLEGNAPYADIKYKDSFFTNSFFLSGNVRHVIASGIGSYTPVFLSDLPLLFDRQHIKVDVALIQVSPPDKNGNCSLGVSVEACKAALRNATYVIAQVNKHMPRIFGDAMIHVSDIDFLVPYDKPLFTLNAVQTNETENQIGKHIASLIEDGSCIQLGIGSIPDATLSQMYHLKNLGVHTELLTDGVLELIKRGIIDGSQKKIDKGKIVASFMMGSQSFYDFVDDNPMVELREATYTNEVAVIRQNPKMVSINSAIEVDITGQVCADSIGTRIYSGVGGQIDFVRGASLSEGGKSIIALPSVTKRGESKIVPFLKTGAGVVTTRSHVQYVVTEYGIAELYGKNIHQRIKSMINIAHPDHREALERQYFEVFNKK
ncbi:acetyl-CoA hydrolase/transferase family protein [Capnocytophaga sp.]|uniref:acetyl-CoA hydrolase/transferase family protein n=1 Tax=Capnocytophaga sp. TaxID=44737 RepID=UPI0026DD176B|nr:acetyl-CoA hydrolase/transferase C-terminal domain-containing protein [Capnocytophaga sp.]MDO5105343.1 acetyl-CoA hydrolase/transferase C-terminal domain-containing protein [Capnocytophaga sp.]